MGVAARLAPVLRVLGLGLFGVQGEDGEGPGCEGCSRFRFVQVVAAFRSQHNPVITMATMRWVCCRDSRPNPQA